MNLNKYKKKKQRIITSGIRTYARTLSAQRLRPLGHSYITATGIDLNVNPNTTPYSHALFDKLVSEEPLPAATWYTFMNSREHDTVKIN